ncbi:MAG: prephenate dehydrogenase [Synergistaceae bacterium]|jgi:prephenate dehydrogenase|nr:prephenate dehydrogenase [Synergistaceae bacterium]
MGYRICIIGLGLMGASLAGALKRWRGASIAGMDADAGARESAKSLGIIDEAYSEARHAINGADLVIFCVYAHHIPLLIEKNAGFFRPGSLLTDICGVKSGLYAKIEGLLPESSDYVGIHPMAGKERAGFKNADPAIYKNSGFIICPLPASKPENIALMRDMASYIGAARVAVCPPDEHDSVIAYTSDLMHIASAALCVDYHPGMTSAFTAGAFRDCTRVADIDAEAWTELLMDNREFIKDRLDRYISNLSAIRGALEEKDGRKLFGILSHAGKNKREMLKR